jgi:hypothetical protein
MKKIVLLILFIPLLSLAQSGDLKYYGEKISSQNTVTLKGLINHAKDKSLAKVNGTILSSCPKKGCWMQVQVETDTIQVTFKDYGFFVPKTGLENKKTVLEGFVKQDTISIKMLRHYAEDAGKSSEEILSITEPEYVVAFTADGVIIQD